MAVPRRESLCFALEARALDTCHHGFLLGLALDFGLDLAKGGGDVEFAADAKAGDAFEHQVEAPVVERLDIDNPPDAADVIERRRLAILLARDLARLDHPDLPVACQHLLPHRSEEHTSELQSLM